MNTGKINPVIPGGPLPPGNTGLLDLKGQSRVYCLMPEAPQKGNANKIHTFFAEHRMSFGLSTAFPQ